MIGKLALLQGLIVVLAAAGFLLGMGATWFVIAGAVGGLAGHILGFLAGIVVGKIGGSVGLLVGFGIAAYIGDRTL